MKKILILALLLTSTAFSKAIIETPNEGLVAILNLYKEKNYDKLVRERYTEIHKAKTEPEIKEIIKMQADFMVDEQTYNNVISFFEEIKDLDPILSIGDPQYVQPTETGERAKFKAKSGRTYRLFKMKSGRWGFHM